MGAINSYYVIIYWYIPPRLTKVIVDVTARRKKGLKFRQVSLREGGNYSSSSPCQRRAYTNLGQKHYPIGQLGKLLEKEIQKDCSIVLYFLLAPLVDSLGHYPSPPGRQVSLARRMNVLAECQLVLLDGPSRWWLDGR